MILKCPILDDGLTHAQIYVPDTRPIAEAKIGIRLDHPRLSDLSLNLVSPEGTRVMLMGKSGRAPKRLWARVIRKRLSLPDSDNERGCRYPDQIC